MNECTVLKDRITCEHGLPYAPRWFADNRVAFQADEQGLGDIDYFNKESFGHYKVFHKNFWGGMRFYISDGIHNYLLAPQKCEIFPFGYSADNEIEGIKYHFSIFTVSDTIFIILKMSGNTAEKIAFTVEFYSEYCLKPGCDESADIRYASPVKRVWKDFAFEGNRLTGGFTEGAAETWICFGSNGNTSFKKTPRNAKNILCINRLKDNMEYAVCISFGTEKEQAKARCTASVSGYKAMLAAQHERYEKVAQKAPVLKSPYPDLNRFFALAPLYHESLKVTDTPGAIRAQTTHYWVWGWDSMTSNEAPVYWGDASFLEDMAECLEKHADFKSGIAHAFSHDMKCVCEAAPPAQGMYLTLLYLIHSFGGKTERHYRFAKEIFSRLLESEVRDLGLCRGTSLYPDFRGLIKETGNDISCFNNTVSYCAVRSMEKLACAVGDKEIENTACGMAKRLRENFLPVLFDEGTGFVNSSADADTLEKRNIPSNNSVKWENNFCGELLDRAGKECIEFYEKNLVTPAGLRPIPVWNESYDQDANQLSCWWPVMTEFYSRLINRYNKPELVRKWVGWVEYWTDRLTCPEGISCYADTDRPPFDNWNCMSGIWHAYSIRGWYAAALHSVFGVDIDEGGLTFFPYSGEEMELLGLHFGERTFDIRMCGSGGYIKSITVNGKTVFGTNKVPFDLLKTHNIINVQRSNTPGAFCYIKNAFSISINDYSFDSTILTAVLHGSAENDIVIGCETPVTVAIDGKLISYTPDKEGVIHVNVCFAGTSSTVCLSIAKS